MKTLKPSDKFLHNQGFTVVELLAVLTVIGILAAIAIPNYANGFNSINLVEVQDQDRDLQKIATVYLADNGVPPSQATLNQAYSNGSQGKSITGKFVINSVATGASVGPDANGDTAQYYVICSTMPLKNAAYVYSFDDLVPRVAALGTDPIGNGSCGANSTNSSMCGANVAAACPCAGSWTNHGDYTSCVAHALNACKAAGQITGAQRGQMQSQAAQSSCGD